MWEVLVRTPRGTFSPRKFSLLLATILMASFGYILATSPIAAAATDVTWDGDAVMYKSEAYEAVQNTNQLPGIVSKSPAVYQRIEDNDSAKTVHFIYFSTTTPQDEKQATYVRYTLNPPNNYTNKAGEKTLSATPVPAEERLDTDDGIVRDSCTIDGIGWMVCPVMNSISEGIDFIFERIRGFLVVQPISSDINNPVYRIWQVSRDFANIIFIIGFLVIIYNYIVGGGMNGYEVRKIIPRLVIAAVLINISYVICAVAVDISNIAGYGVNQLFEQVRDSALAGASASDDIPVSWTSVTTWVLAGGIGTGVAIAALPGTIGGAAGLWYLLAPFLVGAALLVIVTFLILAARQAIIIIAIAIAPLAFAALILPNTEKWFERWRGLFFTMLIMFPAFAAVFGGAQLAGEIIIRSANSIELVILGLGVMVAPLAITPLLLKLGGGVLGRIGGIINNKEKGVVDRFRNYSGERRKDAIAQRQAGNAAARRRGDYSDFKRGTRAWRRRAGANYAKAAYRKELRERNEESALNDWHSQTGRWGYDSHDENVRSRLTGRPASGYRNLNLYKRDNQLQHDLDHAHHEEHWQQTVNADASRRQMLTDTRLSEGRAKVIQGALEAQDERTLQTALNTDAAYANLRQMKVNTSIDSGVADMHKNAIEAAGKLALSTEVSNDRALRQMKVSTYATEKQAEVIDNTLQKKAEANWHSVSRNDEAIQQLRLKELQASDGARRVEEQWNTLVENIVAKGADAPQVAASNKSTANSIMGLRQDIQIEGKAQEAAKVQQGINLMTALKQSQEAMIDPTKPGDPTLLKRAAGIGGQQAEARIFAQATKSVVDAAVTEVKDNRYLLSQYTRGQLHKVLFQGRGLHNEPVTTEMRQAAMYELLTKKGNNDDAHVIRDAISDMGMVVDETSGEFYEPMRDSDGRVVISNGKPVADTTRKITDTDDISRRRDWQQFFADASRESSHSQITLSGTDKSDAEAGTLLSTIKGGFMRDALGGKFGPEKMLKADIDELKYLYTDITDTQGEYSRLDPGQQARVKKTVIESVLALQKHPTYKGQIDDRNRGVMNQIVAELDPSYSAGVDSDGKPLFYVDDDKSLIPPPANPTGARTFSAPAAGTLPEDRRNIQNQNRNKWTIS